jgi:hypothetical protein
MIASSRRATEFGRVEAAQRRREERIPAYNRYRDHETLGYFIRHALWYLLWFGMPQSYLKRMLDVDRTWANAGVNRTRWRNFLKTLVKEWSDSNLLVSTFAGGCKLNVNFCFVVSGYRFSVVSSMNVILGHI